MNSRCITTCDARARLAGSGRREPSLLRATDVAIRAKAYRLLGPTESALRDLREAVRLTPEASVANDNLAWFLATCPEDRIRKVA